MILRVDRTDPSKNVVRGFRAYELYLEAHPEDFEAPEGYVGDEYSVAAFRAKPGVGAAGFKALIRRARRLRSSSPRGS